MDTAVLVKEKIDEGQRLIDELNRAGFDVAVAIWAQTSYDGKWLLYIASPVVDAEANLNEAYRKLHIELPKIQLQWMSPFEIRLIGTQDPIAVNAINYQNAKLPFWYVGRSLGNLIVDAAYIYPQ